MPPEEDAPAISGEVHFSDNGFSSFTLYRWPIEIKDRVDCLIIRHRDDGLITTCIEKGLAD